MKPIIPAAALQQHIAVLGKTGSGKTSTGKLLVEQVVGEDNARVCILDTVKSDWWGLTSSADGKKPGLPFHILGGPHGHVPIHASAGKAIAEIVASGALRHSIIDMADFEAGGAQRFFVDFAPALLRNMRGVLYLVIEEAHELAPKERSGFDKENMSVHYAKKLATAGRSKGIRLVVLTQRTQSLHNALLGSCETMIVHRLTAPADQEPVLKWLKSNASGGVIEMIAGQISSLKTGAGWVCSGEAKIFERIEFPRIKTYDNSATPTDDAHQHDVKTAPVDHDNLRSIIGAAVKEAEADDPKLLRTEIAKLKAELGKKPTPAPVADLVGIAAARQEGREEGVHDGYAAGLRAMHPFMERLGTLAAALHEHVDGYHADLQKLTKAADTRAAQATKHSDQFAKKRNSASSAPSEAMSRAERQILIVLAQRHPKQASRVQLSILSGYSISSSSFSNALGALRSKGWCNGYGDDNRITDEGLKALGAYEELPSGQALVTWWLGRLGKAERAFLEYIAGQYPKAVSKEELAGETGYSLTSSSYSNALGKLRSLELISRGGEIRASEELFNG